MTFDHTHGNPNPHYLLMIHHSNGFTFDKCFFDSYREAKTEFEQMKNSKQEAGTVITIYDYRKDIRKDYYKFV